jgi:epoxide hydrolase 4
MITATFGYCEANGIRFHVAQAGPMDGPLVILLHGFPEFWFGWRAYIEPLAQAGFRVIVPDQRGYNLTGKPKGAFAYRLDNLADDVVALAQSFGRSRFHLVGHDWGASVGWWTATRHADRIDHLVAINAPHPAIWRQAMTEDPVQRKKSGYVRFMRLPVVPEWLMKAGNFGALAKAFASSTNQAAFGADAMAQYSSAWAQPGALTSMVNWYRALFLQELPRPAPGSIMSPTLMLWGEKDAFASVGLAEASLPLCAAGRLRLFPNASHWTHHDEVDLVRQEILEFLGATRAT